MAEPNNTPQAESPVLETTPLLAASGEEGASTLTLTPTQQTPAVVRIATLTSLTTALAAFGVLLAAAVVNLSVNPQSYVFATLNEAVWALEWTLLAVILFDSINIHKLRTTANARTYFPLLVQIPADLLLTVFILNWAGQAGDAAFSFLSCPDDGSRPTCERWLLALKILIGIGIGAAAAAGVAHLSLAVIRTVAFFRGRLWTGSPWTMPAGQLTFEFTIKVLRQDR